MAGKTQSYHPRLVVRQGNPGWPLECFVLTRAIKKGGRKYLPARVVFNFDAVYPTYRGNAFFIKTTINFTAKAFKVQNDSGKTCKTLINVK